MDKLQEIKRQFELVKDTETFVITTETVWWLIEQAERLSVYREITKEFNSPHQDEEVKTLHDFIELKIIVEGL